MSPGPSRQLRGEEATEALIDILRLAAPGADGHELMSSILEHVRNWVGCQAAGIRLRDGADCPYFEVQGLPAEFTSADSSLCDDVLSGRFDPEKPFLTSGGSFWTNSTTDLLASTAEAERLAGACSHYSGEGYESVTLVPLRWGGEIIGLLELCDKRRDRLAMETMAKIERVAGGLAVVLAERQARQALSVEIERHRTLFEQAPDGILVTTPDGTIIQANVAACAMFGRSEDELQAARREDLVVDGSDHAERVAERDRTGRATGELTLIRADGTHFPVDFTYTLLRDSDGPPRALMTFRDITERKRTEESLRKSERDLVEAQELAHIGNYTYDLATQQLTWSEGTYRIFGLDPEHGPLHADISSWMSPEDYERISRAAVEAIEHGTPYELEFRIRRPDGTERTIATTCEPRRDATGKVVLLRGTHQDITERRRAEEDYRTLFREMLDGFALHEIICDKQGNPVDYRFLAVNPAFEHMTGLKAEQIVGRTVLEVLPGTERHWIEDYGKVALTGTPAAFENPHSPLGKHFHVTAFQPRHGQFACIFADVTKHKQAEDALRGSEAKMRGILDNIRVGVALISPKMEILELNPQMREWFPGIDEGQQPICYRAINDPPREIPCDNCPTRMTLQDGLAHEATREKPTAGGVRDYRVLSSPIFDASGEITAAIELVEDVTERLTLEAQLQQARKMESVGRLAGGVAHDFNNMLGVILGHTEMALEQTDPAQPVYADLTEIRKAAERSAELTRQLLAFARKQTVAPRVLDLNETVAGMLKMLERLIGEHIALEWQPGADLWPVKVDPSQIGQILTNLCVNARDAIANVGRVAIATRNSTLDPAYCAAHVGAVPGDYVELTVGDDGCGMDNETVAQLFEPFFTTKDVGEGTGLGLPTVYGIVKQNSGFIEVKSKLGEGSTFTIYLPRHAAVAEPIEKERALAPAARGHETILLVEDEPAILKMTAKMLEGQGYTVVAASTPGEAICLAREHHGDLHLLLTDVVMPEMNGRDLAKNLLSLYPRIGRLFMSGYTSDVIAHQGALEEGVHFIQKPFTAQDLATQVRAALDSGE